MKKIFYLLTTVILLALTSFQLKAASINYSASSYTFYNGVAITSLSPTVSGGTPVSYSVSPALIAGLTLNTSTGVISGTPTANTYYTSYVVTVNFASGSANCTLGVYVDGISYFSPTYTFYQGSVIKDPQYGGSTITPTIYGTSTSVSISPALPTGLTFNTSTGAITGTPSVLTSATNYTITATYAGGSSSTVISIQVLFPTVVYSATSYIFYNGATVSMPAPTASGTPTNFSISPSTLPGNGSYYFQSYNGTVAGTPSAPQATTAYTFSANYAGGVSVTETVNITIDGISYAGTPFSFQDGAPINTVSPTNTGETPTSYSISPSLPAGLSFNTSTGKITGTPSTVTSQTTYTVTATYGGGSSTTTIQITTTVPYLTYTTPNTFAPGVAITNLTPTVTNSSSGNPNNSYTVSPALPTGLTLNTTTGVISGTPTSGASSANYAVTGTFSYGNAKATFLVNITILGFSYTGSPYTEALGTAITSISPTVAGTPYSYSISPSVTTNTGLSFDTSTGIISGTPTIPSASTSYTVTANYGGLPSQTATVTIYVPSLTLAYTGSPFTYTTGTAITALTANTSGATPTKYSSSPDITATTGLILNTSTGQISGTPSVTCTSANVVITATYGSYTATATLVITVGGFYYAGSPYTLATAANGQTSITASVTTSLAPSTKYTVTGGTLPAGLAITTTTGDITGIPTAAFTSPTTVTVTAKNASGSTVLGTNTVTFYYSTTPSAAISYSFPTTIYTGSSVSVSPTITQSASITPTFAVTTGTLPTGLTISSTTGVISGYPSTTTTGSFPITVTYTYENANPKTATTSFTINVAAPSISYSGSSFTYFEGTAISSLTPGGNGTPSGYAISPSLSTNTGLSFSTTTGVISGTPTIANAATAYTITASYNGVTSKTFNITIASDGVNYTGSPFTYTLGTAITTLTPTHVGTLSGTNPYSISPSLNTATGLTFNTTSGAISGTPTISAAAANYTITANFTGGSASSTINIAITVGTKTWTGTSGTDWNTPGNWTGGVPTINSSATIPTSTNKPVISSASSCASVIITGNTSITLNAALTVSGGLNIGVNDNLTLAGTSSATFSGTSIISSTGTLTIGSTNTVNFPALSNLTLSNGNGLNNTAALTNNGTLNITSSTLSEGTSLSITNTGTLNIKKTTVTLSNPLTGNSLTNSGTITANNKSVFTFNDSGIISNTGTFFAGTSNSGCTLNLGGISSSITNTGNFVMGPTSTINLTGTSANVTTSTGQFILMSDVNNSASIGQITGLGAGFTGQYYVQRNITGNNSNTYRSYRVVSSPVNSVSSTSGSTNYIDFSYLNQNFTPTYTGAPNYHGIYTGGPGSGFSFSLANPLVYIYNETLNPASPNATYYSGKNVGVTSISGTSIGWKSTATGSTVTGTAQLPAGNGLLLYYLGSTTRSSTSTSVTPDNAVVSYKGYLNQGNLPVYLWYTPEAGTVAGTSGHLSYSSALASTNFPGYNLVGNPYASTLDLAAVYGDNPSGFTTFYELTDAAPQAYVSYNANTGATSSASASEYVESGQGFFVIATAAGQTLTFKEDQKYTDTTLLTSSSTPPGLLVSKFVNQSSVGGFTNKKFTSSMNKKSDSNLSGLHLLLQANDQNFHETGIYFSSDWSDGFDRNDAIDMDGIAPKLFLSSFTQNNVRTSINSMGTYAEGKKIKLYVAGAKDGNYNLYLSDLKNIDTAAYQIFLVDQFKKDSVDFAKTGNYSFDIVNSDSSSYGSERLLLSITRKAIPGYELISFAGAKVNKAVLLSWITQNEGANTSFEVQKLDAKTNQYAIINLSESNGAGNYSFTDNYPINGNNTYRLVQIANNTTTYSQPVTIVYNNTTSQGLINVYPNPASETLTVDFSTVVKGATDNFTVNIYNSMGVLITQKSVNTSVLTQNVNALQSGTYVIQIKANNGSVLGNAKFIKK